MMNRANREENTFTVTLVVNAKGDVDKGYNYIQEWIEDIENISALTIKDSEIECIGNAYVDYEEEY